GVDGVADGGSRGRQRGLAEAGGRIVGLMKMHFHGGRLRDAEQRILVEVALSDSPVFDRDFLIPCGAEAIEHRSLNLVFRSGKIEDRTDVDTCSEFVDLERAVFRNGHFGDDGDVSAVAEVKGDSLALPFWQLLAPAGFFGGES